MIREQFTLDLNRELIVDNFAGGGGASTGIEIALGRHVDIAINHDPEAVAMHSINHPQTDHHCENVWDVDPGQVTSGRPVGFAWFSPDCKHFSKAKGGKPREKKIRGLAWVVMRWVDHPTAKPRVLALENVEEFKTWGPLRADGMPDPDQKGRTFRSFVNALKRHGYQVEWRELRACDYGAPTIRKRLFLLARCDGAPIVWPAPTHGDPASDAVKCGIQKSWLTAADCIDWTIPVKSIFERTKPLAEATMTRIARGIRKYVLESAKPFLITLAHGEGRPGTTQRTESHTALAAATLIKHYGGNYEGAGVDISTPTHTVTTTDHHALLAANLVTYYGAKGPADFRGSGIEEPIATQTTGNRHALVASHILKMRHFSTGQAVDVPLDTIAAGGLHFAEVRTFLQRYDGGSSDGKLTINGEQYLIADIGMRMLEPHELYAAQGFPKSYVIAPVVNGKRLSKDAQVRMCGNSVCPPIAAALVRANAPEMAVWSKQELKKMRVAV